METNPPPDTPPSRPKRTLLRWLILVLAAMAGVVILDIGCGTLAYLCLGIKHIMEDENRDGGPDGYGYGLIEKVLEHTVTGLNLCAMSIEGGRYDWQSPAVLRNSPYEAVVIRICRTIVENPGEKRGRRVAAYQILWSKTRQPDELLGLYRLVREKQLYGRAVRGGRNFLALWSEEPEWTEAVNRPNEEDLTLAEEEIRSLITKLGIK